MAKLVAVQYYEQEAGEYNPVKVAQLEAAAQEVEQADKWYVSPEELTRALLKQ